MKLNAKQLRKSKRAKVLRILPRKKNDIYIILDNVLDTYNIGSVFRLADAVAAKKVYLCGGSATPPNPRIKKASINTTDWVAWSYKETAVEAINELRTMNPKLQLVAIEQSPRAIPYDKFEYKLPICLVVGHESEGVSKEVLEMADAIVELPMYGVNISLNVMVSLAIVLYRMIPESS